MEEIRINTPFIKLDQLVKFAGLAETGARARILIDLGEFNVNGEYCTKRGKKIKPGDVIEFKGKKYKVALDENAVVEEESKLVLPFPAHSWHSASCYENPSISAVTAGTDG